jgi:Tfp pilus assembly protein PilO
VRARLESLSSRSVLVIAVAVVVLYAAAVWMLMVSPKRSDASTAQADLAAAELRLVEAQAVVRRPRGNGTPVADVFRLARAMPSSADQPGLVLEISRLARRSGVTLRSITPQDQVSEPGGPALIPVAVTISGNYGKIAKFLALTRGLVTVRDGKIDAEGRLLSVQSVALVESVGDGFPKLDATIALDAYVYDGPILPPDAPEPTDELPISDGTDAAGSTG